MDRLEEDLLTAIKNNPDNRHNREVYADYLEMNGEINKANYLRLKLIKTSISADWLALIATEIIDVRCPKCNFLGSSRPANLTGIRPFPSNREEINHPENYAFCRDEAHAYFDYYFERGLIYKFNDATYIFLGGIEGKWWKKI